MPTEAFDWSSAAVAVEQLLLDAGSLDVVERDNILEAVDACNADVEPSVALDMGEAGDAPNHTSLFEMHIAG